jgi:hypothetical protein
VKLRKAITIKTGYTRSINLERDATGTAVIEGYIPTSRALRTLSRIADSLHDGRAQRAWSLVGPYGSGKSSFALFASQILSDPDSEQTKIAYQVLTKADKNLALLIKKDDRHYLRVLVTGSPEPLTRKLLYGLLECAESYYGTKAGRNPKIIKELTDALAEDEITVSRFLSLLDILTASLEKSGISGIFIVIDELGKFLEYEARHYGANDIFLLQALAEHASKASDFNLLLLVMLHQSFEQYAKGLGESLKNEWGKIQGRFEEIPFLESEEQVLRVVSAAFENKLKKSDKESFEDSIRDTTSKLGKLNALPGVLSDSDANRLFNQCYPLHPVTAMILPSLCQKIAQNERTLFSYLGSQEDHGVTRLLADLDIGQFVLPHQVFDYFVANQTSFMGDYSVHRRWVEVQTALERLGDANEDARNVLKTIGLFNIMGSRGEFKPSKELLGTVFANKAKLTRLINLLEEKSVINYRKFSREYRVWQGSDFNLEEALATELNNLGNFALADELNQSDQLMPIVARKYSIASGALRYFEPLFVDAQSFEKTPSMGANPRVIFFLAFGEDDKNLIDKLTAHFSDLDILVRCATSDKLRDAIAEVICLRRLQANSEALNSDPVAKREFEDRLFTAASTEQVLIGSFHEEPELHQWRHKGQKLLIHSKRDLQSRLSEVLGSVYTKAPIIHNELINRDRPSVQANGARNRLLLAMQEHEDLPDLGIQKFPAEKAVYRALLKETGLHVYPNELMGKCQFQAPTVNSTNIHHVWQSIDRFLETTEKEAKSFIELSEELMAPPYGVKAGLLPVLYFVAYLVNQKELALYENRKYRPHFTVEMIERFTKRPDEFTIQRFRISGLRASIFQQYSKVIHGDTEKRTLLELAKPLASFMGSLPEYTQKTRRGLSPTGQKLRAAFNLAKSPERLLFEELPRALGYGRLENASEAELEDFSERLIAVLRDLRDAHDQLVDKQKGLLAQAFNREPDISLSELRKVSQQLYGLESYTNDSKGLSAFISRLTKIKGDDGPWFENVLMFLGHKPSTKWLDSDQDSAEYRLNDFSNRIIELEKIRLLAKESGAVDSDVDFFLLKSIKKGAGAKDQVVLIDEAMAKRIGATSARLRTDLDSLESKEMQLAALAMLVDEFLEALDEESEGLGVSKGLKIIDGGKQNE